MEIRAIGQLVRSRSPFLLRASVPVPWQRLARAVATCRDPEEVEEARSRPIAGGRALPDSTDWRHYPASLGSGWDDAALCRGKRGVPPGALAALPRSYRTSAALPKEPLPQAAPSADQTAPIRPGLGPSCKASVPDRPCWDPAFP